MDKKEIGWKILAIVAVLIIIGIAYYNIGEVRKQRDTALTVGVQLSMAYEDHLTRGYNKSICGIEAPTLTSDNRAGTAKDLACMAGVQEKAKAEVAELMKIKK